MKHRVKYRTVTEFGWRYSPPLEWDAAKSLAQRLAAGGWLVIEIIPYHRDGAGASQ